MEAIKDEELLKFPQRPKTDDTGSGEKGAEIEMQAAEFQQLDAAPPSAPAPRDKKLDLLMDITLPVSVELGRANVEIRDILALRRGSVIELDALASEPVDIVVNGRKMAEGEVVVIDKHFAVRITALAEPSERLKGLGK